MRLFYQHRNVPHRICQLLPRRLLRSNLQLRALSYTACLHGKVPVKEAKVRKRRAKFTLDELSKGYGGGLEQGLISPDEPPQPLPPIEDVPKRYPTVIAQALDNITRLPNCVLFTRVGGFYELYFSHAEQWASRLGLKLAVKKTTAGNVPMAGFPFWNLERFLKVLVVEEGQYVAICEEYPAGNMETTDPGEAQVKAEGGLLWDRRIARIVTPGTLIDETWIEEGENHFLLAVEQRGGEYGLAWADLGTGEVWCSQCQAIELAAELARIGPREVVVPEGGVEEAAVKRVEQAATYVVTTHKGDFSSVKATGKIQKWAQVIADDQDADSEALKELKKLEFTAALRLLDYVESRLPGIQVKLQTPVPRKSNEVMGIDVNSMRGLEIKTTLRDGGSKGSLLHTINRTVTRGGKRLLGNWLTNPSTDVATIEARLDLVETFLTDKSLREDIVALLKTTHDSQRIVQKFSLGRGDADDLVALARTIEATNSILQRLSNTQQKKFDAIIARLEVPLDLAETILKSIDEEGLRRQQHEVADVAANMGEPASPDEIRESDDVIDGLVGEVLEAGAGEKRERKRRISRGIQNAIAKGIATTEPDGEETWIMKKTASPFLREAHARLQALREAKGHLEVHLRNKLNAQSLTLKWSPNLGHFCHVKGKDVSIHGVTSVQSSKTTRSFLHPEWTKLGENMVSMRLRIRAEEKVVFQNILKEVFKNIGQLRRNARVLDELDVAAGFALLAREQGLTRPKVNRKVKHKIIGGRHITVEAGLREQGKTFTGNDCFIGDKELLWLVTGPNMAGKSTFLRQNVLISILAQTGSFVPAEHAEIGIVDKIFSRIGSADNLYNSQSTFMVEMLETAHILRSATPRSFVIMDEIGRGTSSRDGLAIAYATLTHLIEVNKSRTLFATHFHELADMVKMEKKVACHCTDVSEDLDGMGWSYVHKLRKGVNKESHALKVARLAGVPPEVLAAAERVLKERKEMEEEQYGFYVEDDDDYTDGEGFFDAVFA
ncbi:hypothetical protein K440DRAFT_586559 [Wilcoxina mikolae CBS 423.85]|nr:hypothetical protein K440DRAFT_586559 [Wilcoxina mikolae CBS 423.85]